MSGESERIDEQGEAKQIGLLSHMSNAVGATEVEAALNASIDRLSVVASLIEAIEVGIRRRNGAQVLRPIQSLCTVFVVKRTSVGESLMALSMVRA